VLEAAAAGGQLAPHGGGARVIYGHTDSLFVLLPQVGWPSSALSWLKNSSPV
jgi:DNA polymerase elongation subunit (family B)